MNKPMKKKGYRRATMIASSTDLSTTLLIKAMEKPSWARNCSDIARIYEKVQQFAFFQQWEPKIQWGLSAKLKLIDFKPGDIIARQGNNDSSLFILLEGHASVVNDIRFAEPQLHGSLSQKRRTSEYQMDSERTSISHPNTPISSPAISPRNSPKKRSIAESSPERRKSVLKEPSPIRQSITSNRAIEFESKDALNAPIVPQIRNLSSIIETDSPLNSDRLTRSSVTNQANPLRSLNPSNILRMLHPGDSFGDREILHRQPYRFSLISSEQCKMLELSCTELTRVVGLNASKKVIASAQSESNGSKDQDGDPKKIPIAPLPPLISSAIIQSLFEQTPANSANSAYSVKLPSPAKRSVSFAMNESFGTVANCCPGLYSLHSRDASRIVSALEGVHGMQMIPVPLKLLICRSMVIQRYEAGDVLLEENKQAPRMIFVLSGRLGLYQTQFIDMLKQGQLNGQSKISQPMASPRRKLSGSSLLKRRSSSINRSMLSPRSQRLDSGDSSGDFSMLLKKVSSISIDSEASFSPALGTRVAILGPGSCAGENLLHFGNASSSNVVALESVVVLELDDEGFLDCCEAFLDHLKQNSPNVHWANSFLDGPRWSVPCHDMCNSSQSQVVEEIIMEAPNASSIMSLNMGMEYEPAHIIAQVIELEPVDRDDGCISLLLQVIQSISFLKSLPTDMQCKLTHTLELVTLNSHDCLLLQGDEVKHVYVVLSGSLSLHSISKSTKSLFHSGLQSSMGSLHYAAPKTQENQESQENQGCRFSSCNQKTKRGQRPNSIQPSKLLEKCDQHVECLFGSCIGLLWPGGHFGESSIMCIASNLGEDVLSSLSQLHISRSTDQQSSLGVRTNGEFSTPRSSASVNADHAPIYPSSMTVIAREDCLVARIPCLSIIELVRVRLPLWQGARMPWEFANEEFKGFEETDENSESNESEEQTENRQHVQKQDITRVDINHEKTQLPPCLLWAMPLVNLDVSMLLTLLKKDSQQRSKWEVDVIAQWLSVLLPNFLGNLPTIIIRRFSALARIRYAPIGHVLCHQGSEARSFRVLLSGSVLLHVLTADQKKNKANKNGLGLSKSQRNSKMEEKTNALNVDSAQNSCLLWELLSKIFQSTALQEELILDIDAESVDTPTTRTVQRSARKASNRFLLQSNSPKTPLGRRTSARLSFRGFTNRKSVADIFRTLQKQETRGRDFQNIVRTATSKMLGTDRIDMNNPPSRSCFYGIDIEMLNILEEAFGPSSGLLRREDFFGDPGSSLILSDNKTPFNEYILPYTAVVTQHCFYLEIEKNSMLQNGKESHGAGPVLSGVAAKLSEPHLLKEPHMRSDSEIQMIKNFLQTVEPFHTLPSSILHHVALHAIIQRYNVHQVLMKEGSPVRHIYIIIQGQLELRKKPYHPAVLAQTLSATENDVHYGLKLGMLKPGISFPFDIASCSPTIAGFSALVPSDTFSTVSVLSISRDVFANALSLSPSPNLPVLAEGMSWRGKIESTVSLPSILLCNSPSKNAILLCERLAEQSNHAIVRLLRENPVLGESMPLELSVGLIDIYKMLSQWSVLHNNDSVNGNMKTNLNNAVTCTFAEEIISALITVVPSIYTPELGSLIHELNPNPTKTMQQAQRQYTSTKCMDAVFQTAACKFSGRSVEASHGVNYSQYKRFGVGMQECMSFLEIFSSLFDEIPAFESVAAVLRGHLNRLKVKYDTKIQSTDRHQEAILDSINDPELAIMDMLRYTVRWRKMQTNDVIVRSGDPIEWVYVLVEGKVNLYQSECCASHSHVTEYKPGQVIGADGIVAGRQARHSFCVRCVRSGWLLQVRLDELLRCTSADHANNVNNRSTLLRNLPCFSHLTPVDASRICMLARERICVPHCTIAVQNGPADRVIVVQGGECRLLKKALQVQDNAGQADLSKASNQHLFATDHLESLEVAEKDTSVVNQDQTTKSDFSNTFRATIDLQKTMTKTLTSSQAVSMTQTMKKVEPIAMDTNTQMDLDKQGASLKKPAKSSRGDPRTFRWNAALDSHAMSRTAQRVSAQQHTREPRKSVGAVILMASSANRHAPELSHFNPKFQAKLPKWTLLDQHDNPYQIEASTGASKPENSYSGVQSVEVEIACLGPGSVFGVQDALSGKKKGKINSVTDQKYSRSLVTYTNCTIIEFSREILLRLLTDTSLDSIRKALKSIETAHVERCQQLQSTVQRREEIANQLSKEEKDRIDLSNRLNAKATLESSDPNELTIPRSHSPAWKKAPVSTLVTQNIPTKTSRPNSAPSHKMSSKPMSDLCSNHSNSSKKESHKRPTSAAAYSSAFTGCAIFPRSENFGVTINRPSTALQVRTAECDEEEKMEVAPSLSRTSKLIVKLSPRSPSSPQPSPRKSPSVRDKPPLSVSITQLKAESRQGLIETLQNSAIQTISPRSQAKKDVSQERPKSAILTSSMSESLDRNTNSSLGMSQNPFIQVPSSTPFRRSPPFSKSDNLQRPTSSLSAPIGNIDDMDRFQNFDRRAVSPRAFTHFRKPDDGNSEKDDDDEEAFVVDPFVEKFYSETQNSMDKPFAENGHPSVNAFRHTYPLACNENDESREDFIYSHNQRYTPASPIIFDSSKTKTKTNTSRSGKPLIASAHPLSVNFTPNRKRPKSAHTASIATKLSSTIYTQETHPHPVEFSLFIQNEQEIILKKEKNIHGTRKDRSDKKWKPGLQSRPMCPMIKNIGLKK